MGTTASTAKSDRRGVAVVALSAAIVLAGCSTSEPGPTKAPSPPTPDPAATEKPSEQTFGPAFDAAVPSGPFTRINPGVLLSHDRSELTLTFTGAHPYLPSNPCSEDYRGWAKAAGDVLSIAIEVVDHPDQVGHGTSVECTLEGYGYLFHLRLPNRFFGSEIRDLGSARLWAPNPNFVADPGILPVGWSLRDLEGSDFSSPDPKTLVRTWLPASAPPDGPAPYLTLFQAFGGPTNEEAGTPMASVTIAGAKVDVLRGAEQQLIARWMDGSDGYLLVATNTDLALDAFVAIANSIRPPRGQVTL